MSDFLSKLFTETIKLSPDMWAIVALAIVAVAFIVALVMGLLTGNYKKIKSLMRAIGANPSAAVAKMKQMPQSIKALYKSARVGNIKPSTLLTEQVCVEAPYKNSLVSKTWLVTFVATIVGGALAAAALPFVPPPEGAETSIAGIQILGGTVALVVLLGGLLTLVGAILGRMSRSAGEKAYCKFAAAIDGEVGADNAVATQSAAYAAEGSAGYVEQAQQDQIDYVEQPAYVEAQGGYVNAQNDNQVYAEPVVVQNDKESEADARRKAKEEAVAKIRAQQEEQARARQAQTAAQQPQPQAAAKPQGGSSSADAVIAQIEKIEREGATREVMRDVATLLQKERAKPENKTPEQQKRLNDALSKLLKAMSAAAKS